MSYSLFADLTQLPETSKQFAATDLVHLLIQYVAHDVCTLKRNTQVSFRIVDKARTIWTNINNLIDRTEKSDAFDWESYDKFIAAIDPLEEALFDLSAKIEKEVRLHLPEETGVDVGLQTVETWKSNRKVLRDSLSTLCNSKYFKDLTDSTKDAEGDELKDIYSAYKHDDLALLSELYSSIEANVPKIRSKRIGELARQRGSQLNQIRAQLASVQMPVDDDVFVLTISYSMLMFGVMEMSANAVQYPDWASYPKVKDVWKAANKFLDDIKAQIDDATIEKKKLQEAYNDFVKKLKELCPTEMPESFLSLIKTVGTIRRPYYGQALAYVAVCRHLAKWFESEANKTSVNVLPLQDAFDKTLDAFNDAVAAAASLREIDSVPEANTKAVESLAAAKEKLKQCFTDFKLEAWNEYDTKITTAIATDQGRMKMLKVYQDDPKHATNVDVIPVDTVDITIKPFNGETAIPKEKTLKVRPDARLAAVRHDFCKYLDVADKSAALASFDASRFKKDDGTVVALDTEIKGIAKDKKCTLKFIIGPPDVKPKTNGV